jgi:hypothetical protein
MMPSKATDDNKVLPYDVDELETSYNVPANERLSKIHAPNAWDYLWSTITAAQKAKEYYHRSFLLSYSDDDKERTESTSQGRVHQFAQKCVFNRPRRSACSVLNKLPTDTLLKILSKIQSVRPQLHSKSACLAIKSLNGPFLLKMETCWPLQRCSPIIW